ncbi:MAG: T9SS type A sorting domain-containing protein [Sphingobacteriales bacterium]|nr:MAG: T9SS type A sorting domain-containing protein [Sphingobacteriales bacterium]
MGRVSARGTAASYSLLDASPILGVNYYRLKQFDRDGKWVESGIVKVTLTPNFVLSLSPNPSRGQVLVRTNAASNAKLLVQVVDIAGNMVYNKQHTGGSFTLDLSALPAGSYVVRVGEHIQQLVIAK